MSDDKEQLSKTFSENLGDMVKGWLPLTITLMVFSGSIIGIFFRTEDRLTRLEITTTYISKQMDSLISKVEQVQSKQDVNGAKIDTANREIKKNGTQTN